MKNRWRSLLIGLLVIGLLAGSAFLAGCGSKESSDTTATEATGPGEVITLKYADQNPVTGWAGQQAATPWLKQIEDAAGGKVKIEPYFGETLFKGGDTWESLKAGLADFAWCFHGYWAGMTPLADVVALPFLPFQSAEQGSAVLWQLFEEFPSLRAQFADNHPVIAWTSSPYYLLTTKKPVETLDDFKGLKIRTIGGPPTKMMEALGAVPVSVPMPETYTNLQTGVLDGILQNWEALYSFRHYEVGKYLTKVPFHVVYFTQSFNTAKWESLPDDVKASIESVSGTQGSRFWGANMFDSAEAAVEDILREEGYEITIIEPDPSEVAAWIDIAGEPLWEEWVATMEAQGLTDARAILDRVLELIQQGL